MKIIETTILQKGQKLADKCEKKLDWNLELGKEYDYSSLVFCIIDAVFSMGVHYSSARNAVDCYADYYHLSKFNMESVKQQHRISDFITNCDTIGDFDRVATEVFQNKQRTSPINGMCGLRSIT